MAATAIKMFLMMIVMLSYIVINRTGAIPFVICFFMGYLFFMVFDVAKNYNLMKSK
jgi:TM2 domain-containing membrane protein YozV